MVVGVLICDLLIPGDVRSLKQKRAVVRPLVAELGKRFSVAVSETGELDVYRRVEVSVAAVSGERGHVVDVLAQCERFVAGRPEMELLSARTRVLSDEDLG